MNTFKIYENWKLIEEVEAKDIAEAVTIAQTKYPYLEIRVSGDGFAVECVPKLSSC